MSALENFVLAGLAFLEDQGNAAVKEILAVEEFFGVPEWTLEELIAL